MHLYHIPQCTIQNRHVHISVLNGVLWDMGQVHIGICEFFYIPIRPHRWVIMLGMSHISDHMVHSGIFVWCIVGFVNKSNRYVPEPGIPSRPHRWVIKNIIKFRCHCSWKPAAWDPYQHDFTTSRSFLWSVITHPCPKFNGGLAKLKLWRGWMIAFHGFTWLWLFIHVYSWYGWSLLVKILVVYTNRGMIWSFMAFTLKALWMYNEKIPGENILHVGFTTRYFECVCVCNSIIAFSWCFAVNTLVLWSGRLAGRLLA